MGSIQLAVLVPGVLASFLFTGAPPRAPSAPVPEMDESIALALDWLAAHQTSDGSWDCDGFATRCPGSGPVCTGPGASKSDVGVTGLAVLAFLRAGGTPGGTKHAAALEKGLAWLVGQQDDEGCIGQRITQHFMYDHACGALALVEAYGTTHAANLRDPAQKAVDFVLRSRNPEAAWRYASPGDGDNDTSVTGWMVKVLGTAKRAELSMEDVAIEHALGFIDDMTDPDTGRTGYTDRGSWSSRMPNQVDQFPPERSEAMTAVGVLTRIGNGQTLEKDPLIKKGADLLASKPPRWETGAIDFYYWYYGTLALRELAGAGQKKWNRALEDALVENQRTKKGEHERGSWDPVDPWSPMGGRVYATALNCLSLESCRAEPTKKR